VAIFIGLVAHPALAKVPGIGAGRRAGAAPI